MARERVWERPRGFPLPRGWYSRINPISFASPPALLRVRWGERSDLGPGEPNSYKQTRGEHKASTPQVTSSAGTVTSDTHSLTESPSLPQGRYLHPLNHSGSNLNTEVGGRRLARLPGGLRSEELGRTCSLPENAKRETRVSEECLWETVSRLEVDTKVISTLTHQQCPTDLFCK